MLLNIPVNPVKSKLFQLPDIITVSPTPAFITNPVVPVVFTSYPAACASVNPVVYVPVPVRTPVTALI